MNRSQPPDDLGPERNYSPMRAVVQDPDAFVRYVADLQRWLLEVGKNLETMHQESRVHLRGTRVPGDGRYDARLRSLPVERQLRDVLRSLRRLTDGLEKSAYKRRAHDEKVESLPAERRAKQLARARKRRNPPKLPPSRNSTDTAPPAQESVYSDPKSIYDLRDRRPA